MATFDQYIDDDFSDYVAECREYVAYVEGKLAEAKRVLAFAEDGRDHDGVKRVASPDPRMFDLGTDASPERP